MPHGRRGLSRLRSAGRSAITRLLLSRKDFFPCGASPPADNGAEKRDGSGTVCPGSSCKSRTGNANLYHYPQLTTFVGLPARKLATLATVASWSRRRASRVAQAMCGVTGSYAQSAAGCPAGSVRGSTTSTAAPASRPSFKASANVRFHDQSAARRVDEKGRRLHQPQPPAIDQAGRFRRQRTVQADHVGRGEQLRPGRPRRTAGTPAGADGERVVGQHAHAEGVGHVADAAADAAEADNSHRFARQFRSAASSRRRSPATATIPRRPRPRRAGRRGGTSSSSRAKVNWATEAVPYSGTFATGMPRRRAAATSTQS